MPDQSLQSSFPEVWQEFRTWRILHWISWIALFLVGGICIAFQLAFNPTGATVWWPDGLFIMGCAVLVAITWAKLRYIRCPRCQKDFFGMLPYYPIFLREGCYHCGLRIYSDDDAQA